MLTAAQLTSAEKQEAHDQKNQERMGSIASRENILTTHIHTHANTALQKLYTLYSIDIKKENKAIQEIQEFKNKIDSKEFNDIPLFKRNTAKRFIDRIDKKARKTVYFPYETLSEQKSAAYYTYDSNNTRHKFTIRQTLALIWIGMHDATKVTPEKTKEAEARLINYFYEINRAHNIDTDAGQEIEDAIIAGTREETADDYSCLGDTFTRLILPLSGIHPDVDIPCVSRATIELKIDPCMRDTLKNIFRTLDEKSRETHLRGLAEQKNAFACITYAIDKVPDFKKNLFDNMIRDFGKSPLHYYENTELIVNDYINNAHPLPFHKKFLEELNALHVKLGATAIKMDSKAANDRDNSVTEYSTMQMTMATLLYDNSTIALHLLTPARALYQLALEQRKNATNAQIPLLTEMFRQTKKLLESSDPTVYVKLIPQIQAQFDSGAIALTEAMDNMTRCISAPPTIHLPPESSTNNHLDEKDEAPDIEAENKPLLNETTPQRQQPTDENDDIDDKDETPTEIINYLEREDGNDLDFRKFLKTRNRNKEHDLKQAFLYLNRNFPPLLSPYLNAFTHFVTEVTTIENHISRKQKPLLTELIYRTVQYVKDCHNPSRTALLSDGNDRPNTRRLKTLAVEVHKTHWGKRIGGIILGLIGIGLIVTAFATNILTAGIATPLSAYAATIGINLLAHLAGLKIGWTVVGSLLTLGGIYRTAKSSTYYKASAAGFFSIAPTSPTLSSETERSSIGLTVTRA